jgi:S1-C subfamily serine protease
LPGMKVVEIERGSALYRHVQGLVVSAVETNSRAWQAGFRPGDIIYAVNRRRTRSVTEFQAALRAADRNGYVVSLIRCDTARTITVR